RLDLVHARLIGSGFGPGMVGIIAEDDCHALSRPSALEIGNCVRRARGRGCGAEEHQREDKISHRFPPETNLTADRPHREPIASGRAFAQPYRTALAASRPDFAARWSATDPTEQ